MNVRSFIFEAGMRHRDENKEALLREKAIQMIVSEGFDGLSMHKLAKKAGISPATIYIYFKNREDLLNQVFVHVQRSFTKMALRGFSPDLSLEKGLWLQWKNRLQFILENPVHFRFIEQFRTSPLVNHNSIQFSEFKQSMKQFLVNCIRRKELRKIEPELFWSLAYGPLYALVRFHLHEKSLTVNKRFTLTDAKLKMVFAGVLRSLKP